MGMVMATVIVAVMMLTIVLTMMMTIGMIVTSMTRMHFDSHDDECKGNNGNSDVP